MIQMKFTHIPLAAVILLGSLSMVQTAQAYVTPEDVLLNKELYLPPAARDAMDRTER